MNNRKANDPSFESLLEAAGDEVFEPTSSPSLENRILGVTRSKHTNVFTVSGPAWAAVAGACATAMFLFYINIDHPEKDKVPSAISSAPDSFVNIRPPPSSRPSLQDEKQTEMTAEHKQKAGLNSDPSGATAKLESDDQTVSFEKQNKVFNPVKHLSPFQERASDRIGPGTLVSETEALNLRSAATVRDGPSDEKTPYPERADLPSDKTAWIVSSTGSMPINLAIGEKVDICVRFDEPSEVRVELFSLLGDRITILFQGTAVESTSCWSWDGRNDKGALVASGSYFAAISIDGNRTPTLKIFVAR